MYSTATGPRVKVPMELKLSITTERGSLDAGSLRQSQHPVQRVLERWRNARILGKPHSASCKTTRLRLSPRLVSVEYNGRSRRR